VDVGTTHRLGEICYGSGNFKDAYEWFKKASEQDQGQATFNNRDSMYNLAICLEQGQGVEKKSDEALKWCKTRRRGWLHASNGNPRICIL